VARRGLAAATKTPIVLADFANATGDPAFDGSLHQILAHQLDNSARLAILPDARVRQTLRLMGRPPDAALTPAVAAEVCERTRSVAVVESSIANFGSEYVLSVRARHCSTGEILGQEQGRANKKDVLKALAQVIKRFEARTSKSLPLVEAAPSLPADATTPSLDAWRSYSAAMKAIQSRAQSAETLSLLKRATEIDPTFAMAYATLGRVHSDLGETETGARNIATAYALRDSVSEPENYYITFSYHRQVTRNLELARQTLESWKHQDPDALLPHGFLSGFVSPGLGHYETAVEEGLKAIAIDPNFSIGYENVAWVYIYLNRPSDAEALLRQAAERRIEVTQFSLIRYACAVLRRDSAATEREITRRRTKLQTQGVFEHQEALTHACRGRMKEALRLSDLAVTLARQGGLLERAAQFAGARAVWNALFEIRVEAGRSAALALSLCRSRDADYGPAFALALLGDSTGSHEIETNLEQRYPQDTSVQFSYLPVLRALDALNRNDPEKALRMTQAAGPYDAALPGTAFFTAAFFGALYPVYVRGLAYARLGQPGDASREFKKILDHPGLVATDPIGPMAHLQLARALSAVGDRDQAAAVYRDLLAFWNEADPDIPVVKQATIEHASA
jgi:tetratricopeptide (TPR) repeat protein